jgi:hypothetical protein
MFQEGRTVTTVEHANHLANEFGKGILRKSFEHENKSDLLEYLPKVKITVPGAVMDAIGQHLAMSMLIDDLNCTLLVNRTNEDFLTSDHPVALCNSLPSSSPFTTSGFASRGLIMALPLSPHALILLTDAEVYKVAKSEHGVSLVTNRREIVDLNLAQCFKAHENLYFASLARVRETLDVFERRQSSLRRKAAPLTETTVRNGNRTGILFEMEQPTLRLPLPKAVELRRAAKTNKYAIGDAFVRNPMRAAAVEADLDRLEKLRKEALRRAEAAGGDESSAE